MSSSLADRLRGIVGPGSGIRGPGSDSSLPGAERRIPDPGFRTPSVGDAAEILDGAWAEGRGQRYLVVDRTYGPGHRHGGLAMMDVMPDEDGLWPRLSLLCAPEPPRPGRLLFVDLETTGLAGGAGTYAFLVGCAWFDGPMFRIRQFFLSAYAAERALLDGVAALAGGATGVVSFNGKSFDLPLIETRFLYHRGETPFAGLPHVDMLHPARRLWRGEEDEAAGTTASCRLGTLEQTLCGVARDGDVPGFEIPARYFHYVRTGDARPLEKVFEHNRLDLISLALLTARASQLLDGGPEAARTPREALGLGRLYERGGLWDLARKAYALAAGIDHIAYVEAGVSRPDVVTRAEALRCYAVICRRQRRFADAADGWQRILALRRCPAYISREATEALAVHHEHRLRDPHSAKLFALQSLRFEPSVSRQHAVRHRLARLERKLGGPATDALRF